MAVTQDEEPVQGWGVEEEGGELGRYRLFFFFEGWEYSRDDDKYKVWVGGYGCIACLVLT